MSRRSAADATVGDTFGPQTVRITRADLIRYAGASGDFNPIHWNERLATSVGLPDVIAHGMYTMGLGARLVSDWAGDPGAVTEYGVRFARPVVVPNDEHGAEVELAGKVTAYADGVATLLITASFDGKNVLGKAVAKVTLA